ncbi:MAG: SDR family oxidoreductase [Solirubrobacterales bacterium]|nr:SDR family oxidoreductase [Solirubrobacterales bacterium]
MAKTWLITGASRGIGAAIARRAVNRGDRVVLVARGEAVEALAKELQSEGAEASAIRADLTADGAASRIARDAASAFGEGIDVLVNNAALHRGGRIGKLDPDDYEAVIDAGLIAPFRLCQAVLPHMGEDGAIVNIGAVVGRRGFPGDTPYGSAKAGVEGLTRSLAIELARDGITANVVVPGFTETEMTGELDERAREKIISGIPLRRPAEADEVAQVVEWVAGSRYMTGSVVHVDGGLGARL